LAFVFPSLWEGFGLPVLEAMACGTPVITSAGSGTQEVAGDAALLVDPADTDGLSEALRCMLDQPTLRDQCRARGIERAAQFRWASTAAATGALLAAVC
jgi:glycosyltransferase involved in cell wall biosynthesis